MKHELSVDREQVMEDLRQAMGMPSPEDIWEHTSETWTVNDLKEEFGLSDATARRKAEEAVKEGRFVEGKVRDKRGHFIAAYRLACDS